MTSHIFAPGSRVKLEGGKAATVLATTSDGLAVLEYQAGDTTGVCTRDFSCLTLVAAPAPSSLADGGVREIIWTLEALTKGPSHDEFGRGARAARLDALDMIRPLAALSPEAPAREGATHPDAQPFERFPELALHIERMAMTGLVGSMISWDAFLRELNAALTPRHEAPAPTCQKCGGEIAGWLCQQCPAEFRENDAGVLIIDDEAPAEGAGEASTVPPPHWTAEDRYDRHPKTAEEWNWPNDPPLQDGGLALAVRRLNFAADRADPRAPDQMALVLRKDLINVKHQLLRQTALADALRAREGEAVAWCIPGVLATMKADGLSGDIMPAADDEFSQPLYTHPAAPSADKLRIAARKVLDGLNARIEAAPLNAVPVFDGIVDLHDALKAEG